MESSLILRVVGVISIFVGIVLVWNPELISSKPIPADAYKATERRIWWGLFIGLGALLLFHHQLTPWIPTIAATLASLLFGLLIARLIGIVLDGSLSSQLKNVGIELVIFVPLAWWYLRVRT